jgi:hypothetical protein
MFVKTNVIAVDIAPPTFAKIIEITVYDCLIVIYYTSFIRHHFVVRVFRARGAQRGVL